MVYLPPLLVVAVSPVSVLTCTPLSRDPVLASRTVPLIVPVPPVGCGSRAKFTVLVPPSVTVVCCWPVTYPLADAVIVRVPVGTAVSS